MTLGTEGANGGQMESRQQIHVVSRESVTEEFIGERRLWTAVIVNAIEEWKAGTLRARRAAQTFLFDSDNDFNSVCACAGLDPSCLRSKLLKIGHRVEMQGPLARPLAA
ncbi:MAG TPA: hypothetical protein VJW93_07565 [Candidatus Acidoferrales bacterium]|nr:hypothetical protein [Candidatus Acidoferrales bacterium]